LRAPRHQAGTENGTSELCHLLYDVSGLHSVRELKH
jgi:hypothetical protein